MDLIDVFENIDENLFVILLTSLFAFISWLVKGLIEKPINESKLTFEKTYSIRIEILTEIKNRLTLILYFEKNKAETLKLKEEVQQLLLKNGKSAYLSKEILDNSLRISIDEIDKIELIKTTINKIDEELYLMISKIEDEVKFYRKFSNYNPIKKIIGVTLLALQNTITISLVILIIYAMVYYFIKNDISIKILIVISSIGFLYLSNWYLSKK